MFSHTSSYYLINLFYILTILSDITSFHAKGKACGSIYINGIFG